jgi:hypothetical protein
MSKNSRDFTTKDIIRSLTLLDFTTEQIEERLTWLKITPVPSRFAIASIRAALLDNLRFLDEVNMLSGAKPRIPSRLAKLKAPAEPPARGMHYGRQSGDND